MSDLHHHHCWKSPEYFEARQETMEFRYQLLPADAKHEHEKFCSRSADAKLFKICRCQIVQDLQMPNCSRSSDEKLLNMCRCKTVQYLHMKILLRSADAKLFKIYTADAKLFNICNCKPVQDPQMQTCSKSADAKLFNICRCQTVQDLQMQFNFRSWLNVFTMVGLVFFFALILAGFIAGAYYIVSVLTEDSE